MAAVLGDMDRIAATGDDTNLVVHRLEELLGNLHQASRDQLEALASRFEIEKPFDKSVEELRGYLEDKAQEYRALRQQIAALPENIAGIAQIKLPADAAAHALDFESVEQLLIQADLAETTNTAQTKLARANNALLRNRAEQAYQILSAIADSFASVDPTAPAQVRGQLYKLLYDHGLRYGGQGLALAERMLQ